RVVAAAVGHGVQDMVVAGIEMAEVVAVDHVDLPFLAAGDHQVGMSGNACRVGQEKRGAGAEVRIGPIQGGDVVGDEVVGNLAAPAIGVLISGAGGRVGDDLDQRFIVVGTGREAAGVQGGGAAAAVAGLEIEGAAVGLK